MENFLANGNFDGAYGEWRDEEPSSDLAALLQSIQDNPDAMDELQSTINQLLGSVEPSGLDEDEAMVEDMSDQGMEADSPDQSQTAKPGKKSKPKTDGVPKGASANAVAAAGRDVKESHSEMEKKRREAMNHFVKQMYRYVPEKDNGRADKLEILKRINDYLAALTLSERKKYTKEPYPSPFLSEHDQKEFVRQASTGILLTVDCNGFTIVDVTEQISTIVGIGPEDLNGQVLTDFVHWDDTANIREQLGAPPTRALIECETILRQQVQPVVTKKSGKSKSGFMDVSMSELPSEVQRSFTFRLKRSTLSFQAVNMPSWLKGERKNVSTMEDEDEVFCVCEISGYFRGVFDDSSSDGAESQTEPLPMISADTVKGCRFYGVVTSPKVIVDIETPQKVPRGSAKSYFCRTDLTGKHTYTDSRTMELLGYTPQELRGKSGYDLFHPDDLPGLAEFHLGLLNGRKEGLTSPFRMKTRFTTWQYFQARTCPIDNPHTKQLEYLIVRCFKLENCNPIEVEAPNPVPEHKALMAAPKPRKRPVPKSKKKEKKAAPQKSPKIKEMLSSGESPADVKPLLVAAAGSPAVSDTHMSTSTPPPPAGPGSIGNLSDIECDSTAASDTTTSSLRKQMMDARMDYSPCSGGSSFAAQSASSSMAAQSPLVEGPQSVLFIKQEECQTPPTMVRLNPLSHQSPVASGLLSHQQLGTSSLGNSVPLLESSHHHHHHHHHHQISANTGLDALFSGHPSQPTSFPQPVFHSSDPMPAGAIGQLPLSPELILQTKLALADGRPVQGLEGGPFGFPSSTSQCNSHLYGASQTGDLGQDPSLSMDGMRHEFASEPQHFHGVSADHQHLATNDMHLPFGAHQHQGYQHQHQQLLLQQQHQQQQECEQHLQQHQQQAHSQLGSMTTGSGWGAHHNPLGYPNASASMQQGGNHHPLTNSSFDIGNQPTSMPAEYGGSNTAGNGVSQFSGFNVPMTAGSNSALGQPMPSGPPVTEPLSFGETDPRSLAYNQAMMDANSSLGLNAPNGVAPGSLGTGFPPGPLPFQQSSRS